MRLHDFSPGGYDPPDAASMEFNPFVMNLGPYLDRDTEGLFVGDQEDVCGEIVVEPRGTLLLHYMGSLTHSLVRLDLLKALKAIARLQGSATF